MVFLFGTFCFTFSNAFAGNGSIYIPESYSNIFRNDKDGTLYIVKPETGEKYQLKDEKPEYTLEIARGNTVGTENGIKFDFSDSNRVVPESIKNGTLYYGFIKWGDGRFPVTIYYKDAAPIDINGRAFIDIKNKLKDKYDMIDWETTGKGTIGYRVADSKGNMIYDGKVSFVGKGPFGIDNCIVSGPFLYQITNNSVVIAFETNYPAKGSVVINGKTTFLDEGGIKHEILINGLNPDTVYDYTVSAEKGSNSESYTFRTAPNPGVRTPFVFAYASDSRTGQGGGERSLRGTNAYMMKKVMALACAKNAAFLQYTGDMINGYGNKFKEQRLEYCNWKQAIQPWAANMPVYTGMGNHEAFSYIWVDGSEYGINVDRFPYTSQSAEQIFAEEFVHPLNGPDGEDGSKLDPNPDKQDFPSYKENVYYYTYNNVAMVVLNSNYWYSSSVQHRVNYLGGNPHGYVMGNQLKWINETLDKLEKDENIDFVFATIHTPAFPNGGHLSSDMWYSGTNDVRPWIAGKPIKTGIIERRDELWKALMDHPKVFALLTGDEHNYNRLLIKDGVDIYGDYDPKANGHKKIAITRPVWQIHNGAAGSPYASKEQAPWSEFDENFTTQNAVILFHVDGKKITLEVINPDTLGKIDYKADLTENAQHKTP